MIHLLIAYDDQDARRGDYFTDSQKHLAEVLKHHCTIHSFDTSAINTNAIETKISALNESRNTPFVFVNYSHGETHSLHTAEKAFINEANAFYFGESLFYACSCLAGIGLKDRLMAENCTFFMGYKGRLTSIYPETEHLFYICENTVVADFLSNDVTIRDSIKAMYKQYSNFMEDSNIDSTTRSVLAQNLSYFVFDGDETLAKKDFYTKKMQ